MAGFRKNIAIVIGINTYQQGIPSLKTAVNDAKELAHILQEQHGYTTLLFLDQVATGSTLLEFLTEKLPDLVTTNDRCLFYFAGHGIALNGEDGPEGYLIPQDARLGDVSTYLAMSQVHKALLQLSCRHFLGILDCCFAGAFRWSSTRKLVPVELGTIHKERFDRFIQDPAWQILTSAAYDQTALDAFDLKNDRGQTGEHSPFAAILIDALEGKADLYPPAEPGKSAGDGVLTATELYLYLRDRIEVATEAHAMRQTPGICPLSKHDKGEYIFLSPGHELNLPPAPLLDSSKNPYRGLEAFEEQHRELFFGRKALAQKLYEFVISHSLTVVLGASGSGKSSVVKAGLVPKLRPGKDDPSWSVLPPFRPGEDPFRAVNKALAAVNLPAIAVPGESAPNSATPVQQLAQWFEAHPQVNLLLVIDQFEELITLCRNDKERQQFLELLATAITAHPDQLHLVLTLRSDFEPQFRNTPLEQYWQAARFVVPAMTREELRQAIEEPASARVMYFNPHGLVDQLIDEVAQMPGALPLLSFALSELYLKYLKRQDEAKQQGETIDRAITEADYEEVGGVTRSLTQRADQEYDALVQKDPDYEYTIRNVMLRMVAVGGELARRRVPLSELKYAEPENGRVQKVLERFETARLLTPGTDTEGQPYQEPAHDALVRGWKRLLDWKQKHLGSLILQRELTSDVNQWKTSGKKNQGSGLLWIEDPRLPTALQLSYGRAYKDTWLNLFKWRFGYQAWQSQPCDYWLNESEADFVRKSFEQKFQRFRNTTIIVVGFILTLGGLTGYAFVERKNAEYQATMAQLQEQSTRALNLLPTANAVSGLILAIDTIDRSQSIPEVEMMVQASLLDAVQVSQEVNRLKGHEAEVTSVAFSRDGQRIVSGGLDTVRLWDARTGQAIGQPLKGHSAVVASVAFSSDGQRIVSGSGDNTVRLWDARTGQAIGQPLKGHSSLVTSVAFSPDGQRIVSGSEDETVRLWDAKTGQAIRQPLKWHSAVVASVVFSPDGQRLVSGSGDNTMRLWDARTDQAIGQPLKGHSGVVYSVAFSPDGQRLVSVSSDNTVRLWDLSSGALLVVACNRLQSHPLLNQPETVTTDPEFLKVARRAKVTCQQRVLQQH
ncbi:MAG: caspase family protein [Phormidium tanganyikae FI6-MK23]|jgi:hypothetical protein|nr:caspase family protein [Phormidium tanganyikae FI6-MK23]